MLVSFNQKIKINPNILKAYIFTKVIHQKNLLGLNIFPGRILIYKGDPHTSRYLQVLDHIPLGNNKARVSKTL